MATDTSSKVTRKKREDRIGERYGMLLVTGVGRIPQHVLVTCDCGAQKSLRVQRLVNGTVSCGCQSARHGQTGTPEFRAWESAAQRCNNVRHPQYENYGGRGITMCARWAGSFSSFYADMGPRPDGMSLDRIDNSKGYSPENCRWATRTQQNRNTRYNRVFPWFGVMLPLVVICNEVGARYNTVRKRLSIGGWGFERAIFTRTGAT